MNADVRDELLAWWTWAWTMGLADTADHHGLYAVPATWAAFWLKLDDEDITL